MGSDTDHDERDHPPPTGGSSPAIPLSSPPPTPSLPSTGSSAPPPTSLSPTPSTPLPPQLAALLVPFTAGGDTLPIPKLAPLTTAHYTQTDTSLNTAIWDLIPLGRGGGTLIEGWKQMTTAAGLNTEWAQRTLEDDGADTYTPQSLLRAAAYHERARVAHDAMHLETLCHALLDVVDSPASSAAGEALVHAQVLMRPHHRAARDKPRGRVEAVGVAVGRAREGLGRSDDALHQSDYFAALCHAYTALLALYPWSSMPLLFTHAEAVDLGIAPVSSALWANIAFAALALAPMCYQPTHMYHVARGAADAVINARFSSRDALARAYNYKGQALAAIARDDPDAESCLEIARRIGAGGEGEEDDWAHRRCYTRHVCVDVSGEEAVVGESDQEEAEAAEGTVVAEENETVFGTTTQPTLGHINANQVDQAAEVMSEPKPTRDLD